MLSFSRFRSGVQGGLQGHCHVLLLDFALLLLSLGKYSTHWYFLLSIVLTGAWRWAVARMP